MNDSRAPLVRLSRLAALTVACLSSAPLAAGQAPLPPVGVSGVRGQFFENEDLLAYEVSPGDELALKGRELFLHLPNGAGRSKLTLDYLERTLGVRGTQRSWKTVLELASRAAR